MSKVEESTNVNSNMKTVCSCYIFTGSIFFLRVSGIHSWCQTWKNNTVWPVLLLKVVHLMVTVTSAPASLPISKWSTKLPFHCKASCMSAWVKERLPTHAAQLWCMSNLPLQVAVALMVHYKPCNKFLVHLLHSIGFSTDYNRVLCLKTSMQWRTLFAAEVNEGMYISLDLVTAGFLFCAASNLDFLENTADANRYPSCYCYGLL